MKKHDEGYALVLVLVVMVVMCLVAVSIMSLSLDNLQRQQDSIQHTKDQYAAQGEIEKIWVQLEQKTTQLDLNGVNDTKIEDDGTLVVTKNTIVIRCKFDGVTIDKNGNCTYSDTKELGYDSYTIETVAPAEGGGT